MKNVAEIRANNGYFDNANKTDGEVQTTATIKEIMDAFGILSDIQVGLQEGFITAETAAEQINHAKKHLLESVDALDPERELRRDTMFVGGMFCSCA